MSPDACVPTYSHASPRNCSSVIPNTAPRQPSTHAAGPGRAGFGPGRVDGQRWSRGSWFQFGWGHVLACAHLSQGPKQHLSLRILSPDQYIGANGKAQKSSSSCASSCLRESASFKAILNSQVSIQCEESCSLSCAVSLLRFCCIFFPVTKENQIYCEWGLGLCRALPASASWWLGPCGI